MPLGVLQASAGQPGAVRFDPELPESIRFAIGKLAMGNVLKINLRFHERFWEKLKIWDEKAEPLNMAGAAFLHAGGLAIPTWWTQLPIRAPILVGWTGGPNADRVDCSSDRENGFDELLDLAIESLGKVFGISSASIRDQLAASYQHDWRRDPFTRGAYSYVTVDGLRAQESLSEPVGRSLFFAGEALAVGHIGTVHGAIQSGIRAARKILELN